ncbi:hypothetical protein PoB_006825700 [Plakobranchus ocellatus]|uniref:Uncharacterized protein n=1 Tax=Plakobranchus ocellatus TaxID=259542 RepID=A0AAV4DCJ1_9GAST|nr:hypothetical protein PoB_006825700 [Plakobranchus ocellatus]
MEIWCGSEFMDPEEKRYRKRGREEGGGVIHNFMCQLLFQQWFGFLYKASPQQSDPRLSGPPSGRGSDGGARTREKWIPADLRADSLATVPPTPLAAVVGREAKKGKKWRKASGYDSGVLCTY